MHSCDNAADQSAVWQCSVIYFCTVLPTQLCCMFVPLLLPTAGTKAQCNSAAEIAYMSAAEHEDAVTLKLAVGWIP